jgi:hypothetical protein
MTSPLELFPEVGMERLKGKPWLLGRAEGAGDLE